MNQLKWTLIEKNYQDQNGIELVTSPGIQQLQEEREEMEEKMKELVRERDRAVQENEDLSERAQRRQVQLSCHMRLDSDSPYRFLW